MVTGKIQGAGETRPQRHCLILWRLLMKSQDISETPFLEKKKKTRAWDGAGWFNSPEEVKGLALQN